MAKKKIETSETVQQTDATSEDIVLPPAAFTAKQELELLHAEMTRLGIHSIGQLEVKISQQK